MSVELLQLPSLRLGRLGSSLDQTVLIIRHSHVHLQRYICSPEISKFVWTNRPLRASSAWRRWLLILAVRHAKPSVFTHGKRT